MKVAVIGCGYVGLITGIGLVSKGHKVIAIDIDPSRVERINKGIVPFYEPGVAEALKACLRSGNFHASTSVDDVVESKIIIICVQTPSQSNGVINLQILLSAAKQLEMLFKNHPNKRIVVVKSTVIPGTTDTLISPVFKKISSEIDVVFNPEFLREGSALEDFLNPDRIVIGTHSTGASKVLKKMYTPFNAPIIVVTPTTAELSKYASNLLLATLISFSNEIARICERTPGADVEDVLGIVHQDRRFISANGKIPLGILTYLKAGCGFGGSCFPKDLSALIAYAYSIGEEPRLFKAVETINAGQPIRLVNMVSEALSGLDKRAITVLGVAFKGGIDDLRESPGLRIVDELLKRKAKVTIYDPLVDAINLKSYKDKGVIIASNMKVALGKAKALIIASNAPEFHKLNYLKLSNKNTIIVDGRRILKVTKNSKEKYYAVGLSRSS